MSDSTQLLLKALAGIIAGIFVASGHLDATNQDTFSQNINTIAGAVVTIISAFYLLEHAFQSAKAEIDWNYGKTPTTSESPSVAVTKTVTTTSVPANTVLPQNSTTVEQPTPATPTA